MNTIGIIMEVTGWIAFAGVLGVVYVIHTVSRKIKAERAKSLPIQDLLRRL
jgi:hypothetical protein